MIWHITKKELKEIFRKGIFKISVLILMTLLLVSLAISYSYNQYIGNLHEKCEEESRELWDNQDNKNQHSAAHYGLHLLKPKSFLALWDNGLDRYSGAAIFIEPHLRNNTMFKAVQDSPMLAKWGELTPSFILLYLLPLLIIWMTFNIVSGEQERGTYRLLRSQGVSSLKLLEGKSLAIWIIILLLVVPVFCISGIFLGGISFFSFQSLLLLLIYLLYAGIFIHVGVTVSAIVNKSGGSMVVLIGIWIFNSWVVPKITTNIVQKIYPSPLESLFKKQIDDDIDKDGINRHDTNHKNTIAFTEYALKKYNVDSLHKLPFNFNGYILQAAEDTNNVIIAKHYADLYKLYENQMRIHTISGVLSPYTLVRQLSMGVCNTDLWTHIHFMEATDEYRKIFIKTINDDLIKSPYIPDQRFVRSNDFWEKVPKFSYQLPGLHLFGQHYTMVITIYSLWFIASLGMILLASKKLNSKQ